MLTEEKNIIPVLLGGDLNAYSVALSFSESYGIRSHVFSRYKCGATMYSDFITLHVLSELDDAHCAVPELLKFASENNGAELYIIPCADRYVEMLEHSKGQLGFIYNIFIPDFDIWRKLSNKNSFYSLLSESGILFPKYKPLTFESFRDEIKDFEYPAVLKAADSVEYFKHPFPEMQKVCFPKTEKESQKYAEEIYSSGYKGELILQEKINGTNAVLTTVSDKRGRVVRAVLGEVILEECGKTSFGNHAAIITRPLDSIAFELIALLDRIGYVGIANIDIMYSDDVGYALELNARQGRSCDYLRGAGVSLAELILKGTSESSIIPDYSLKKIYWHHPPHRTVLKYAERGKAQEAERLRASGAEFSPYKNKSEGVKRKIYEKIHGIRLAHSFENNVKGMKK